MLIVIPHDHIWSGTVRLTPHSCWHSCCALGSDVYAGKKGAASTWRAAAKEASRHLSVLWRCHSSARHCFAADLAAGVNAAALKLSPRLAAPAVSCRPGPPAAFVPTVLGQVYQVIDAQAVSNSQSSISRGIFCCVCKLVNRVRVRSMRQAMPSDDTCTVATSMATACSQPAAACSHSCF